MIHCNHCDNITSLTEAGARSIGWRIYQGPSQGGDALEDVACPTCSGRSTALKTLAAQAMEQDALFQAEPVVDFETKIGNFSPPNWNIESGADLRWEQCLTEIADGLEDASFYAGGPESNSGKTMLYYVRRIRQLMAGNHESCDGHD